jgi:predicted DNA-binding transcriptional regulator AlpA
MVDGELGTSCRQERDSDIIGRHGRRQTDRLPHAFVARLSEAHGAIWRLERTGAFPKHHRISANAVAWVEQDVVEWMRAKASAR